MLKKIILVAAMLLLFATSLEAQVPLSVEIFGGGAGSDFDSQESGGTGIVMGAALHIDLYNRFDFGADFNTLITPFRIEDTEVSQTYFGVFGKYDLLLMKSFKGYVRGGLGMYSGEISKVQEEGKKKKKDDKAEALESTAGFNLGFGIKQRSMGFYGEFTYHFVDRESDKDDEEPTGFNNWMLVAGYRFRL